MVDNRMNKRGSIPVTILVILAIALFVFSIFLFSMNAFKAKASMGDSFKRVIEFNVKEKEMSFEGKNDVFPVRQEHKKYFAFGDEILDISVSKIAK
jgi:hypothetical protein